TIYAITFDYVANTVLIVPCGKKSVYETAEGWCSFSNIVEDCASSGIEDIVNESSIEVYPNPAKEKLTIKADNEVSIFNNNGQLIKVVKNIKGTKEIGISDLESGIYYIKTENTSKKLIVE
ncbi:MAG: T9SS type A sorting domain-containing protein, partial [Bacteroidales bacterium]|nr:T9SS type A sorting domain-containing protein [Bacteroidales bacterium]